MSYSTPKLAVRDSFDDEDVSDDIEDEVFIRDGRNGFKLDEERGVKRPLMAPRRKLKSSHFHNEGCRSSTCKVLCIPCCYGFVALTALLGLIALVVLLIMWFPIPLSQLTFWRSKPVPTVLIPCTDISANDIWVQSFPKLLVESSLQLNDVNKDGIMDIIIGYGSGADKHHVSEVVCTLYFDDVKPCGGGLLALDGRTGAVIWQHRTEHTVLWVDCGADLTGDGVRDCLISGRGGILEVVNGHDGSRVWQLDTPSPTPGPDDHPLQVDVYAGRFVQDVDGDGIQDILSTHTEENTSDDTGPALCGHLLIVSGHSGRLLRQVSNPQSEESYFPPQVLVQIDGQLVAVWGTGGSHSSGGLYVVPLLHLAAGDISQQEALYWDKSKGVMAPPSLVDVNHDGLEDIVVATFNSSVLAFDGRSYKQLWNFSFTGSESSSVPTPAFFNGDNVPDFMVKYRTGPGSLVYYYTQTTVLDGRNGQPLLVNMMVDSMGSQPGGLTISVEGFGNDLFLHWGADCLGFEGRRDPFALPPGENGRENIDLCKLRFNSSLTTSFLALSEHLEPPGIPIYSSEKRRIIEYHDAVNTSAELQRFLEQHPDFWDTLGGEKPLTKQPSVEFPAENGMELLKNDGSNFRHKEDSLLGGNERKGSSFYYPSREFSVPNRGRNRELGRSFAAGEGEEVLPVFPSNNEYPDVHKHGGDLSKHPSNNGQWQHQWRNSELRPPEERSEPAPANNFQGRIFEGGVPLQDSDFDVPVLYFPSGEESFPPGQRDERTASEGTAHMMRGPRLRGDKRGQIRRKRNMGDKMPHGVQKLTSGGVLVPSLSNPYNDSIDVVFITYWVPSSDNVHMQNHIECIEKKFSQTVDLRGKYPGMDDKAIKNVLGRECLKQTPTQQDTDGNLEQFNIAMGQMTVYRLRISCRCRSLRMGEKCSAILPFEQQSWPTIRGVEGKGYFKPRHE